MTAPASAAAPSAPCTTPAPRPRSPPLRPLALARAPARRSAAPRDHARPARRRAHRRKHSAQRTAVSRSHTAGRHRERTGDPVAPAPHAARSRRTARAPPDPRRPRSRTAASRAAIAAVLATPLPEHRNHARRPATSTLVRAAVLCLINQGARRRHGEAAARAQRRSSNRPPKATPRNWSPTTTSRTSRPSGETPVDRIRATGYIPEPERRLRDRREPRLGHATTSSTPQAIVDAWVASPGHLANILEAPVHGNRHRRHARRARRRSAKASPARPTRRSSASSSTEDRRPCQPGSRRRSSPRSLLWPDQRKEVVRTLTDSFCGTLEVTGR